MTVIRTTTLVFALGVLAAGRLAAESGEESSFQKSAAMFAQKCLKCHTVGKGDRVGPDLKGVGERREREWALSFLTKTSSMLDNDPIAKELLKKYNGVRMDDLHLTRDQAQALLDYIDAVGKGPVQEQEVEAELPEERVSARVAYPDEAQGISGHALLMGLVLLVLSGFLTVRGWRACGALCLVLALSAGYCAFGGRRYHKLIGNQQGYAPVQPIAFSHAMHAGTLEIPCLYCHHGAEKGPVAGVPSVNVCMNCHRIVRAPAGSKQVPSPELEKLEKVWNSRTGDAPRSIQWERVHNLPDFVYFNHKAHVQNNIQCQECHGPVETMVTMRQASTLSMGWCVNCHRHPGQPAPSHWKRSLGSLDCTACHQ